MLEKAPENLEWNIFNRVPTTIPSTSFPDFLDLNNTNNVTDMHGFLQIKKRLTIPGVKNVYIGYVGTQSGYNIFFIF